METIRQWLNEECFDWSTGKIIFHDTKVEDEDDEDAYTSPPGWASAVSGEVIDSSHPILDKEFDSGYGRPECPRFIATDGTRLFFPKQYDGATSIVSIFIDINIYLNPTVATPYPGG